MLRGFYSDSRASGEDLKSRIRALSSRVAVLLLLAALGGTGAAPSAAAERAAREKAAERFTVAGGVGANSLLREELAAQFPGTVFYPRLRFCTDNGAMIAVAGALRLADAEKPATIHATARWSLEKLARPAADG